MKRLIFTTTTCGPCFVLKDRLKDIKHNARVVTVNIDKDGYDLAKKWKIRRVPAMVEVQGDRELARFTSIEDITNRLKKL